MNLHALTLSRVPFSSIRTICAFTYFVLGIFCCDRFTPRAFMSETDPVKATAIPQTPVRTQVVPSHVDPTLYNPM